MAIFDNPESDYLTFHCFAGCKQDQIKTQLGLFQDENFIPKETKTLNLVQEIFHTSVQVSPNSPAGIYLVSRGITKQLNPNEVRFANSLYFDKSQDLPALIFPLTDINSVLKGVQRVFLLEDKENTPTKTSKRILGKLKGNSIKFGDKPTDILHIAEGPETSLSIYQALNEPTWSVCSSGNFSSLEIPDQVKEVHIWADHDKNGIGLREAKKLFYKIEASFKKVVIHSPKSIGV